MEEKNGSFFVSSGALLTFGFPLPDDGMAKMELREVQVMSTALAQATAFSNGWLGSRGEIRIRQIMRILFQAQRFSFFSPTLMLVFVLFVTPHICIPVFFSSTSPRSGHNRYGNMKLFFAPFSLFLLHL